MLGVDAADLDDWPTISIKSLGVREIEIEEFRDILGRDTQREGVYAVRTSPGGSANSRVVPQPLVHKDLGCRLFLEGFLQRQSFTWDDEYIFLVNQPCYIVAGSAVILLEDGRVLSETLPQVQSRAFEFRVGGGLTADDAAERMRAALRLRKGAWAPILSHDSIVYGHAISESMTQTSALDRAGLSPLVSYVAMDWLAPAQQLVVARANAAVVKSQAALVKVPRAVFASKMYRHLPLGAEFQHNIDRIRASVVPRSGDSHDKIYLSRLGVNNRQMTDEGELVEALSKNGFRIVAPETLTFEEQVRIMRDARLIVGPYGSQLTNAAFAAPKAILCELRSLNNPDNSPNWDDFYFALAAMRGYSYALRVVETPPGADRWACNVPETIDFVTELASQLDRISPSATPSSLPSGGNGGADDLGSLGATHVSPPPAFWASPDHEGENSYAFLQQLHLALRPATYLEIGAVNGDTLALATCNAIAVGANIAIARDIIGPKPSCLLFNMESDVFFAMHDAEDLLGQPVALALIRDQHDFEAVLRAFIYIEKYMAPRSVVLIDNCVPTDGHIARRQSEDFRFMSESLHPDWWAGDVWKALAALKTFRPDLRLNAFNAYPTGMAAITHFDPNSRRLSERYREIVETYAPLDLTGDRLPSYLRELDIKDTRAYSDVESIAKLLRA